MTLRKTCRTCGAEFTTRIHNQVYCGHDCLRAYQNSVWTRPNPHSIARGTIGAISELAVATHFLQEGFDVFRSMSSHCFCDLVVVKDGVVSTVEVKTGRQNLRKDKITYNRPTYPVDLVAVYVPESDEVLVKPYESLTPPT